MPRAGKRWGTGLSDAERKRKQRKNPLGMSTIPPKDRVAALLEHVKHGQLGEEEVAAFSRRVERASVRGEMFSQRDFGAVVGTTKQNPETAGIMTDVFKSTLGLTVGEFAIEGYNTPSNGSPWILRNNKSSPFHDDVHGQGNRSIPGHHRFFHTLLYVFSSSKTQPPVFTLFQETTQCRGSAGDSTKIFEMDLVPGSWISFPAKCGHMVTQPEGSREFRMVLSVQYDPLRKASVETGEGYGQRPAPVRGEGGVPSLTMVLRSSAAVSEGEGGGGVGRGASDSGAPGPEPEDPEENGEGSEASASEHQAGPSRG